MLSNSSPAGLDAYADFYQDSLGPMDEASQLVLTVLHEARQNIIQRKKRDPIEHIVSRIKSPNSMIEKLKRYQLPVNCSSALSNVHDAVGIRVICTFIKDIVQIAAAIESSDALIIDHVKDYIRQPKMNGYRSYHIIVRILLGKGEQVDRLFVEIQLRTLAMDFWASLEHELRYKHSIHYEKMFEAELKRFSEEIASADLNFQTIRDLIDVERNEHEIIVS